MSREKELLALLEKDKKISKEQSQEITKSLRDKNFNLDEYLVNKKILNSEELIQKKADVYGFTYISLLDDDINEEALNFITEEAASTYKAICFDKKGKIANIGLVDISLKSMEAVNFIAREEGVTPRYHLISQASFDKAFKQYQRMEEEISSALEVKAQAEGEDLIEISDDGDGALALSEDINSAPVAKIVSVIIRHAVESRASDIHIEPLKNESRVRYRIDGILHNSLSLPKSIHNAIVARVKVLSRLKLDETRIPQDGRVRLMVNNKEIDFRVSTLPLAQYEKVVMRILDTTKGAPTLEELGFNKHALHLITENIKKTNGIFLVTGPTGSGKTTTLYSVLDILNKEGVNISTLEDPIEYEMKGVNQSQIRPKIGYTFANGLRSFLRQDPDIIMVGEIRDEETAELSIHAGLTGHFVLSTIHTNDAVGSINRLIDMKIEPFLLVSTLKAVVAQRLARRLCPHCRKQKDVSKTEREELKNLLASVPEKIMKGEFEDYKGLDDLDSLTIYEPVGCPRCEDTGYLGRIALAEVIEMNEKVKDIVVKKSEVLSSENIRNTQEFITIKQDGVIKIFQGVTNTEEVFRVMED